MRLWHGPLKRRRPRGRSRRQIDGYRPRLTPRNLNRIVAKGQSSTDLKLTEAPKHLGFRSPLPTRGFGGENTSRAGIDRRPFNLR